MNRDQHIIGRRGLLVMAARGMRVTESMDGHSRPADGWTVARAALIGAVLVAALTAPTLRHLETVGRLNTNDGRFSIWNIAWIDHALLTSPRNLLNANIFWPHTGTLAYSELNLVAGLFGLPWYAVTGSALAATNGAILIGLWLAFLLMWGLVRRLTGSDGAGLVAAAGFTFCPYVGAHTPHVQLLMIFVVPLVFLAFHRLATRPTVWRGIALGAALAVAVLASGYYGIYGACVLGVLALLFARPTRRYWIGLAVAAGTTVASLLPVYAIYVRARLQSGAVIAPRIDDPAWSANLSSYMASNAAAHAWWLLPLQHWQAWHEVLFPGIGVLVLSSVGAVEAWRRGDARRVIGSYFVLAAFAAWASFGPRLHLYTVLHLVTPGMSLLRAPARFGIFVTFALAVVAGFGAARLGRWRAWAPYLAAGLVACELGAYNPDWGWPSWPLETAPPVSEAYQRLAQLPRGPLVEFPFPYVASNYHNHANAMYWSTYHWQPLVNGYSDLTPPDFDAIALPINFFPDPQSFAIMRARSVRYVLWHIDQYQGGTRQVIVDRLLTYANDLRPIVKTDDIWLYEIVAWP